MIRLNAPFLIGFLMAGLALPAQDLTTFVEADGLLDDNVLSVCRGQGTDLWFGTQSGVSRWDGEAFVGTITVEDGLVHETVFAVLCDSNGDVWMGTDFGLSRWDGEACVTYTTEDGLEDNRIKHVYEDAEGLIWISHNDGVSFYDGAQFTNYTMSDGLPFGGVNQTAQDVDGSMWFSTGLGGAVHFDGVEFVTYTSADGLPNNSVRAVAVDATGKKWVGTNEGIAVFNGANQFQETHLSLIELPPPHVINPVEDVVIDLEGRSWVGVYVDYLVSVGGVAYFNGAEWVDFAEEDGLAGPNVRQLAVAENGDVWVATSTGVTRFSGTPSGIGGDDVQSRFQVAPNPAVDQLHIVFPGLEASIPIAVQLRDASGRLVKSEILGGGQRSWSVGDLPRGLYFLECRGPRSAQVQRVVLSSSD